MYAATRKCSIHTKMVNEGMCNAKMMILRGPECKSKESRYRLNSHGSRSRVWTSML